MKNDEDGKRENVKQKLLKLSQVVGELLASVSYDDNREQPPPQAPKPVRVEARRHLRVVQRYDRRRWR